MSAIEEMITRLEAASEGSREIDVAIWDVVEHWPVADDPAWRHAPNGADVHALTFAPYYTASLDTALTLVPEGWGVDELFIGGDKSASVTLFPDGDPEKAFESGAANTAPLAVCIAALKGRAV